MARLTKILRKQINRKKEQDIVSFKAFLAAENENRKLEDLPHVDFGRVPETISSVVKETVNNLEFCQFFAL